MQDSVAETGEVTHAVANAFQDFGFVVAALGKAASKTNVKGVEDQLGAGYRQTAGNRFVENETAENSV